MAGHTLFLDANWDLTLDMSGDIKTAQDSYGIAQDVANAVRLFTNDAYYDPLRGVPHFLLDLGVAPEMSVVRNRVRQASLGVDGVTEATVNITGITNRVLTGSISLTTAQGETVDVAL